MINYSSAIKYDIKCAKAYIGRAIINTIIKNYSESLADFNMVISIRPDEACYYGRCNTYFNLKDYPTAMTDYITLLQIYPDNIELDNQICSMDKLYKKILYLHSL